MRITDVKKYQVAPFFEIQEEITTGYKSLFAVQDVEPFTLLSELSHEEILITANRYSVQIDDYQHIKPKPQYLQYINHSCRPNVFFDFRKMAIISLRHIERGREITFFYPSTEWKIAEPFGCSCGSHNCLRHIVGAVGLNVDILNQYKLSEHVKRKILKRRRISFFQTSKMGIMDRQKVATIVQEVLIQHFHIQPEHFDWEQPLERLDGDFKVLGNLVYLEQLLEREFEVDVPLMENISATFHTPDDLINLIMNEL